MIWSAYPRVKGGVGKNIKTTIWVNCTSLWRIFPSPPPWVFPLTLILGGSSVTCAGAMASCRTVVLRRGRGSGRASPPCRRRRKARLPVILVAGARARAIPQRSEACVQAKRKCGRRHEEKRSENHRESRVSATAGEPVILSIFKGLCG
jgi:hypothetical protein